MAFKDPLTIAGVTLDSRLLLGTAGYPSPALLSEAIEASGSQLLTLGLKRTVQSGDNGFVELALQTARARGAHLLPNTAGCHTAREAVQLACMARELYGTAWIKLEVIGDAHTLQPDPFELLEAARSLVNLGFTVLPYCTEDLVLCRRLLDAGCAVPVGSSFVMPTFYRYG